MAFHESALPLMVAGRGRGSARAAARLAFFFGQWRKADSSVSSKRAMARSSKAYFSARRPSALHQHIITRYTRYTRRARYAFGYRQHTIGCPHACRADPRHAPVPARASRLRLVITPTRRAAAVPAISPQHVPPCARRAPFARQRAELLTSRRRRPATRPPSSSDRPRSRGGSGGRRAPRRPARPPCRRRPSTRTSRTRCP